jgi:hypothetical protein
MKKNLKYGHETLEELKLSRKTNRKAWLLRAVSICGFAILVLGMMISLGGYTLNVNVGADGQPGMIIFQHPEDSVME